MPLTDVMVMFADIRTISGHKAAITSLDFHLYGDILASGSMDTNFKVCMYHTHIYVHVHIPHMHTCAHTHICSCTHTHAPHIVTLRRHPSVALVKPVAG